jgi:hypothetical protein
MSVSIARCLGAASVLAMSTSAGWADVTAQEVWDEWKSYMSSMGYEVSAQENASGGTVTVSDLTISMLITDSEVTTKVAMPELAFTENGDGTVDISLPDSFPIMVNVSENGQEADIQIDYAHTNAAMTVSGSPEDMINAYASDSTSMALGSITVDGETLPPEMASFQATLENVESSTRTVVGDLRMYEQAMSAAMVQMNGAFDDPESDDKGVFSAAMEGFVFEGSAALPAEMNLEDMRAMLDAGFGFEGVFSYLSGTGSLSGTGDGEDFSMDSSATNGAAVIGMDAETLVYDFNYEDISVNVMSSEIPFPLSITAAEMGFGLGMPLAVSDEEQDFSLAIALRDVAVPDMLWGLVDPTGILPRDAATVALDMSGKTKLTFDLMDPATAASMGDQPPGELHALTLNELVISAAGALIAGSGDFTFDNADQQTYPGMPAPSGTLNLEVVGANGLMDKLSEMGMIGENEVMGARMMMGMLAVPGEGEDTLTSEIEFGEGGSISANGQRIK